MDFQFLQELGLTQNEIKIYVALLKLGSVPSGRITYETGLHRSRVYEGLNRLAEKGLVSYIKNGSTMYFQASSSEKLIDVLDEQKEELEEKKKEIEKIIPELNKFRETKPIAESYILQGIEGFKAMRRDVLKYAKNELLMLGAIGLEYKVMPLFYNKWDKERTYKKIKMRLLRKHSARSERDFELCKIKILPEHIDNPAVINIYGDRVVNVIWKENYPICFVMVNKDIANAYRKYFELLWDISKN